MSATKADDRQYAFVGMDGDRHRMILRLRAPEPMPAWPRFAAVVNATREGRRVLDAVARGNSTALLSAADLAMTCGLDPELVRCGVVEAEAWFRGALDSRTRGSWGRWRPQRWRVVHRSDTLAYAYLVLKRASQVAAVARLSKSCVLHRLRWRAMQGLAWPGDIHCHHFDRWNGEIWGTRASYRQREELF